jgi:hypothetical protein
MDLLYPSCVCLRSIIASFTSVAREESNVSRDFSVSSSHGKVNCLRSH